MGDEATPVEGGNETTVTVPDTSIAEIVDDLGGNTPWSGSTSEPATPATKTAPAVSDEGKDDKSKTDPPPAPKVELFSEDQLDKLTLKDYENPAFDWSKVPPERAKIVKAAIAAITPERQRLARLRDELKTQARKNDPPQPTEEPDPQEKANTEIVKKSLEALGLDPTLIAEMAEDAVRTKGIALAAQAVPEYVENEAFHNAVNLAIVQDERLADDVDSKDPVRVAGAIRTAALQVKNQLLAGEVKSLKDKEATITTKQKELDDQLAAVKEERAKLNRGNKSPSGGSGQGAPPATPSKDGPSIKEIVDELPGFSGGGATLRVG